MILGIILFIVAAVGLFVFASKQQSPVFVQCTLNAPVAKVWELWTNPESIKNWWSPKNFTAPIIKNDFRVEGRYVFSMKAPDGKIFWNSGRYTEIEMHRKIVSTISFADSNGNIVSPSYYKMPGKWLDEVIVTVFFESLGDKTKVTVHEKGIPLIMKFFATLGWNQQFDKFKKLI